ncbi:hypothetical protein L6452_04752 [Arctium lappa]|uniref:Uncharacterized protein n=1 Tax=Arctium lappa TaxID=4217 RepID=A0ACB9EF44_ARCLA|nr:hypothetical protein L6452_04752 [Arctium lappa]
MNALPSIIYMDSMMNVKEDPTLYYGKICSDCFNCLHIAALIDEKILCMHGRLSPDLNNLDQIRNLRRPTDVPNSDLLCDFLWSDKCKEVKGWGMNDRGVPYTFGANIVTEFLQKHDLDIGCRAHQIWISTFDSLCLYCSFHFKMINNLALHAH